MKYTVAEFFSGCGGFSRGFSRTNRFSTVLANDIKPEALKTFAINHACDGISPITIEQDIRTITLDKIERDLYMQGVNKESLDCLIGGPPCQGFSQLRRSEEWNHGKLIKLRGYSKLSVDPRNDLVLRYLEIAERLKPKFILIENVPQMLNHGFHGRLGLLAETVVEILEKDLGYKVEVGVLNAANYGVPQLRERAIFMASAIGPVCLPEATHADPRSSSFKASDKKPWVTVREAISDLSLPSQIDEHNDVLGLSKYLETSSEYANLMRSKKNYPCNHDTRSYRNSVIEIITEMGQGETWDSASLRMRKKYEEMTERYAKRHSITISEANNSLVNAGKIKSAFFKNYYWSAYTRLAWDAPALTITANANFLGSGRFTHPEQMRGITAREAARLQSFDDDFKFITSVDDKNHTNKIGVSMDMIGEAVPPLLAQALATRIANDLDK